MLSVVPAPVLVKSCSQKPPLVEMALVGPTPLLNQVKPGPPNNSVIWSARAIFAAEVIISKPQTAAAPMNFDSVYFTASPLKATALLLAQTRCETGLLELSFVLDASHHRSMTRPRKWLFGTVRTG